MIIIFIICLFIICLFIKICNNKNIKEPFIENKEILNENEEINNEINNMEIFNKNKIIKDNKIKKPIYKIGCTSDSDCNIVYGNGRNICKSNNECYCNVGTGKFCHIGPTNFKDPKIMTKEEKTEFKNNYSKKKFTLNDYKNWLLLHKNDLNNLTTDHIINLHNINLLKLKDIPKTKISPPINSEEYFRKMYKNNLEFIKTPLNSETTGIVLASNFNDYSEFVPPNSLKNISLNTDYKHNPVSIDQCYLKLK